MCQALICEQIEWAHRNFFSTFFRCENFTPKLEINIPESQAYSVPGSIFRCVKILFLMLRCGWVFLERTRILSGIQFTTHFIEFFALETKLFVGSFVNVILTQQTCGQR